MLTDDGRSETGAWEAGTSRGEEVSTMENVRVLLSFWPDHLMDSVLAL